MELAAGAGVGLVGGLASQALGRAFAPKIDANQFTSPFANSQQGNRVTGQVQNLNAMDQQAFRDAQLQQMQYLQQQAQGQGPSVAQMMGDQQAQQLAAQQISQAQGARGINSGLAQRMAMQNTAQGQQGLAASTQMNRLQEIQQANQMLAGSLQSGRGQDLQSQGLSQGYEQLMSQAQLAAQDQKLRAMGLNMGALGQTTGAFGSAIGGGLAAAPQMFGKTAATPQPITQGPMTANTLPDFGNYA